MTSEGVYVESPAGGALGIAVPAAMSLLTPLLAEGMSWVTKKIKKKYGGSGLVVHPLGKAPGSNFVEAFKKLGEGNPWSAAYKVAGPTLSDHVVHPHANEVIQRFLRKHSKRMMGKGGASYLNRLKTSKNVTRAALAPLLRQEGIPYPSRFKSKIGGGALMDEIIGLMSDPKVHAALGELAKKHIPNLIERVGKFATSKLLDWHHKRRMKKAATPSPVQTTPTPSTETKAEAEKSEGSGMTGRGITGQNIVQAGSETSPRLISSRSLRRSYNTGALSRGGGFGTTSDASRYAGRTAYRVYGYAKNEIGQE